MKDLLFTMPNLSTLSQIIAQVVCWNNRFFEYQQQNWESLTVLENFASTMPSLSTTTTSKDDPMQIDQTRFKPFMEQEKWWRHVNKLCMNCGEPGHTTTNCPNKHYTKMCLGSLWVWLDFEWIWTFLPWWNWSTP
jgi:hypothetical protein